MGVGRFISVRPGRQTGWAATRSEQLIDGSYRGLVVDGTSTIWKCTCQEGHPTRLSARQCAKDPLAANEGRWIGPKSTTPLYLHNVGIITVRREGQLPLFRGILRERADGRKIWECTCPEGHPVFEAARDCASQKLAEVL